MMGSDCTPSLADEPESYETEWVNAVAYGVKLKAERDVLVARVEQLADALGVALVALESRSERRNAMEVARHALRHAGLEAVPVPEPRPESGFADCTNCGTTDSACRENVAREGRGCCGSCFIRDTHPPEPPAEQPKVCPTCGSDDPDVDNLLRYTDRAVPCGDPFHTPPEPGETR